jgi:hypothetical protein
MLGFTRDISKIATTPRTGMFACMSVGILIFFDDYSNILLAGETMRPLLDLLSVSREKLSFIVDATSAPIASISPISSWVGFEVSLIQDAIETIVKRNEKSGIPTTIPETGFAIFLQSIKYSYYSFFMLGLIAMLITLQRDFGPMLVAERKVRVYDRTDGGPGKGTYNRDCREVAVVVFKSLCPFVSKRVVIADSIPLVSRVGSSYLLPISIDYSIFLHDSLSRRPLLSFPPHPLNNRQI